MAPPPQPVRGGPLSKGGWSLSGHSYDGEQMDRLNQIGDGLLSLGCLLLLLLVFILILITMWTVAMALVEN